MSTSAPTRRRWAIRLLVGLAAAVLGAVVGVIAPVTAPAGAVPVHGGYVPLETPRRVLDTRTTAAVVAGADRSVSIAATGGIPARLQIGSLVLNVTVVAPSAATHVTVWGSGPEPAVSTLNVAAGETRANVATVAPGTGPGSASLLMISNNSGAAHVIVDVVGWFAAGGTGDLLVPASNPFRLADSRSGLGFPGSFGPGETRQLTVSAPGSVVPAAATAVAVNLTAVAPTQGTHLTAYGAGSPRPGTSTVNAPAGSVVPNLAIVRLTKSGGQSRLAVTNHAGRVDVLVDVVGWFVPAGTPGGLAYYPQTPRRVKDTRQTVPLGPTGVGSYSVTDGGQALFANLTGIAPTAATHLTAYPAVGPVPPTSTLNLVAGQTAANGAILRLVSGYCKVRNAAGIVHHTVDVSGVFDTPLP